MSHNYKSVFSCQPKGGLWLQKSLIDIKMLHMLSYCIYSFGVIRMKSVIIRMEDDLFKEFDSFCKERGYAKQGLIKRLIREMVMTARLKSLPVEEPLSDEVKIIESAVAINSEDLLDWEKVKDAL